MFSIAGRTIGRGYSPYIVAEISGNHGGNLGNALRLIETAKGCGADAVKFQAYTPDTITLDCDFPDFIMKDGPWRGRKLYELYTKAHTPFEWFPTLFEEAKNIGITAFASVFDKTSINMLEDLGCPAYKISSFELNDIPLIRHAARTRKPIIMSCGMATKAELLRAQRCVIGFSCNSPMILFCTSEYPSTIRQEALHKIASSNVSFFGLSDHSYGHDVAVAATALGASMIEKHLRLRGVDTEDEFSLYPMEFCTMTETVRGVWDAIHGNTDSNESASIQARRSLYVVKDVSKGDPFTTDNVCSIRPGYGMDPSKLDSVMMGTAAFDIDRGTALIEEMIDYGTVQSHD